MLQWDMLAYKSKHQKAAGERATVRAREIVPSGMSGRRLAALNLAKLKQIAKTSAVFGQKREMNANTYRLPARAWSAPLSAVNCRLKVGNA